MQRPVLATPVQIAGASIGERPTSVPTLHALEIGQNAGVIPAISAHVCPVVIVARVPANIDHAIDAATAADDFTPGGHQLTAAQMGFGLAFVSPIIARHIHGKAERAWHLDQRARVGTTKFKNQDTMLTTVGQAIGHGRSR